MDYRALLRRAAALAEQGRGEVEPNPCVGALALCDGEVVGEGFHAFWGGPHAEEAALAAAADTGTRPDTVVVTLEPCSSEGGAKKREPCTKRLIAAGVQHVVYAADDPDPRHRGRGRALLEASGVRVTGPQELGELDLPELSRAMRRFARACGLGRPWVLAKWAMTLDGKTATRTGSSKWISDEGALDYAHALRARCDAVVVGIGTALADDPELTVRRCNGPQPLRVVIDPAAALEPTARMLQALDRGPVLVLTGSGAAERDRSRLRATGAQVLAVATDSKARVDPVVALQELARLGVRRVLLEGGGKLTADWLSSGVLDQVHAIIAPKLCGGADAPGPIMGDGIAEMCEAVPLSDTYRRMVSDCFLVGGFVGEGA